MKGSCFISLKNSLGLKKSFTLPELILATAILAIALCSILMSFYACFFLNEANRNRSIAISHAQYILEDIKSMDFDYIEDDINDGDWDWTIGGIESHGLLPLPNETTDAAASNASGLINTSVTVYWKDRGLRDRNLSIITLIAEP